MLTKEELVAVVNRQIPHGVDWKRGAERYVASCFEKMGKEAIEQFSMNKPFGLVARDNPGPAIIECVHYLNNFANALALLKPKHGARVLDVACGGGWVSNYLSKLGYWTYGIDISADFIDLARRRLSSDHTLGLTNEDAASRFSVIDIETSPLPDELRGTFDIVWLESCLHHFVDPVSALEHLSGALKPEGIIVLIEFENRKGAIKEEYMQVMREFDTLERPYSRSELENALNLAGLHEYEFVGTINGWFSPGDPISPRLGEMLLHGAEQMNLAICANRKGRLDAMFPHRARKGAALTFGRGFYESENGYRWSAPSSELTADRDFGALHLEIHRALPGTGQQTVVAYGAAGEAGRVTLTPKQPCEELRIRNVKQGDRITLHSAEAFRPSWTGSQDNRLLSFYMKDVE